MSAVWASSRRWTPRSRRARRSEARRPARSPWRLPDRVTITHTFAAAIAAPPTDDQHALDRLQEQRRHERRDLRVEPGRFTTGPWANWDAYTRNSPVYHAAKVKTPLIILHNDQDGAVDFTQGMEYYNTLRRLGKPVVLLEYPGENHSLARPENQQDYTERMK
jgi:dipeptidyl aminopeptidase/acylaminoacyl peptidase